jgi:hypothetical protein
MVAPIFPLSVCANIVCMTRQEKTGKKRNEKEPGNPLQWRRDVRK